MKKALIALVIIILAFALIYNIQNNVENSDKLLMFDDGEEIEPNVEPIKIGYCPTMKDIADEISNDNSILIRYGSTGQVLQALDNNQIDIAIVGRLLKDTENKYPIEVKLREGNTLVGKNKIMININDLKDKTIHTTIDNIEEYNLENIIKYNNMEEAITNANNEILLVDWEDYRTSDLELVIPIYNNGEKVEIYRLPVIYTYDNNKLINLNY